MKTNSKNFKKKFNNYLLDHSVLNFIWTNSICLFVSIISGFLFAFTIKCMVMPTAIISEGGMGLATGGASGISQDISIIFSIIFGKENVDVDLIYSICYTAVNIPLLFLAWFKIGKKFTIFTLITVVISSLFVELTSILDPEWISIFATIVNENGGMLARAIFGGVIVGLSSALPYKFNFSGGGIDILVYAISSKKHTSSGKFSLAINAFTILIFCLLTAIELDWGNNIAMAFSPLLYCVLYLFVASLVVDAIHLRNKKCEIKIISEDKDLPSVLLTKIPHGATLLNGTGAFTGEEKVIISMVVSSYELHSIVGIIKEEDPKAFIEIFELRQVFGSFYLKPIQ